MKLLGRLASILFVFCLLSWAVSAATFTVTTVSDSGAGSLRQALLDSEANAGTDTVNVAVTGTILLQSSLPTVTQNLTINGGGQNNFIVSGQNLARAFLVSASGNLQLSGLTVRDGKTSGSGASGGGIRNFGTLTINGCAVAANTTDQDGGGIANYGTLTINNTTLSGNSAFTGGGIINFNVLIINNSTLNDNIGFGPSVWGGNGGGILNGGDLTINNSTLSGNKGYFGAAINNASGSLILLNSTVTRNISTAGASASAVNNEATATVGNSIVAQNGSSLSSFQDVLGAFISRGYNLIGSGRNSTGFGAIGDQVGNDSFPLYPELGPLQGNGGATQTHAPGAISPAIDRGKNLAADANGNAIATDQRGRARTRDLNDNTNPNAAGGDGTDIGAVEFQSAPPTAASVTISGRVTTNNRGLANARVVITDADGQTRTALTNPFGYYRFADVAAGATYVVQAQHKRFEFMPQVLFTAGEISNLNFTAAQ